MNYTCIFRQMFKSNFYINATNKINEGLEQNLKISEISILNLTGHEAHLNPIIFLFSNLTVDWSRDTKSTELPQSHCWYD